MQEAPEMTITINNGSHSQVMEEPS